MAGRDGIAEVAELGRVFNALAHPSRRQILVVLHARGDRVTAGEIAGRFACSWPTTSRHLRALEDAGLVSATKEGRERFYRLERSKLKGVVAGWLAYFDE